MLEGKFRDKTHPRCGYPLWKVQPTNIVLLGTQYVAQCPRCFFNLPVDVDPDSIPKPEPEAEIPEVSVEPVVEPSIPTEPKVEPEPEPRPRRRRTFESMR